MTYTDILEHFGGLRPAAKALGLAVTTVNDWRDGVPYGRQCEIQIRTGGVLVADEPKRNGVSRETL